MTDLSDVELLAQACVGRPLPELLTELQRITGIAGDIDVWLWDRQWRGLGSVRTGDAIAVDPEDLSSLEHRFPVHHPLRIYGDAIGFVTIAPSGQADRNQHDPAAAVAASLSGLLALAVRAAEPVADLINLRRRPEAMSLPAEMQSALLPPTQSSPRASRSRPQWSRPTKPEATCSTTRWTGTGRSSPCSMPGATASGPPPHRGWRPERYVALGETVRTWQHPGPGGRSPHPARAIIEDLLQLTGAQLRDDATLVVVRRGRD